MRKWRSIPILALTLLVAALLPGPTAASTPEPSGPIQPEDFAAFADPLITAQMEANHIPGAVLVVVRDGKVIYAKGYGYADLERRVAWDPDRTVFRAKSLSKLVTATAVMQLYERGQLRLHTDVNRYLYPGPYLVPQTFPQPVTAAHLLTHTGGFTDRGVATNVREAADLLPLDQYLALDRYPRLDPPGNRIRYGDHGYVLLGYLVEAIAGRPFPDYVAENIFRPLQMRRSTFAQPWPEELAKDMAMGYVYLAGSYLPQPAGYVQVYPAAGMVTTAADMGRFMLAHLQEGRLGGERILQSATVQEMHRQQFTQHPQLPGLTYGFWEQFTHGRRVLLHAGEGLGFASSLYLLPEERTGIFIATNRRDFKLHEAFITTFLDRYLPVDAMPPPEPVLGYQSRAARYAGVYTFLRHDPTAIEKVNQEEVIIRANDDGTLSTSFTTGRWVEVEPRLFRKLDGEGLLAFAVDGRGNITALFTDHWPWAFEKGQWYDSGRFRIPLLVTSVLVFLSAPFGWPLGRRSGRSNQGETNRSSRVASLARLAGIVTSLLNLAFVAILAPTLILTMQGGDVPVLYGLAPALMAALVIPLITVPLTALLLVLAALAWRRRFWSLAGRIHYTLVALSAVAFTWSLAYLNMIGFH